MFTRVFNRLVLPAPLVALFPIALSATPNDLMPISKTGALGEVIG
jgi:hypothetical protein